MKQGILIITFGLGMLLAILLVFGHAMGMTAGAAVVPWIYLFWAIGFFVNVLPIA